MSPQDSRRAGALRGLLIGASTVALGWASFAAVAVAQTTSTADTTDTVKEVVVTGFRASLENAIATKRSSDQIVESVSAEDIGKLPDNSIAESIARLPGVTAQRLNGRDSVISIRGLAPDFSTTLLNGREQVSTGDNRSVEFDQYPSELIQSVVVYKTPEAGLVGQGIAGTVDLRTVRPLDYKKQVFSFNARGELNSLRDRRDGGFRVSGTYIGQFLDDTLGVSLGVAYEKSPNVSNRWRDYGYAPIAGGLLAPGGLVSEAFYGELKRTGVSGTIQYRPSSNFSDTLDLYYSDYFNSMDYHGLEQGLAWGSGTTLAPGYTTTGNFVTAGTYTGVHTVERNDLNSRHAGLYSVGDNAQWREGPWTIIGDVSFSSVHRRDNILETYAGTGRNFTGAADNVGFVVAPNGQITLSETLNHADPSQIFLTSPQGWGSDVVPGGQDGYLNAPLVRDQLEAYRASVSREVGAWGIKSVEVGGNYDRRFKSYTPDQWFLGLKANLADPTHSTSVPFPSDLLRDPASLSFIGLGDTLNADPLALLHSGLYAFLRNPNADVASSGWKVHENVGTVWAKANIDTELGGGALTGNAGVQVVFTDQSAVGVSATGAPISVSTVITGGAKYTEVLPSVNLSYRADDNNIIRFGAARTLARARMDQMNASLNFSYDPQKAQNTNLANSPFSGGGGNPELRPWISDDADLSFEHYFGRSGYVAAAAYYKWLESYIYNQSVLYDFSSYPVPPCTIPGCSAPVLHQGFVNIPANGTGGRLYGFELSGTLPLTTITGWIGQSGWDNVLDGFGVTASGSYTQSQIHPDPNNPATPLPGLSTYVANGTVYYEKNGFSARISTRFRSKYLGEVSGFGDARTYSQARPETILDAQIGYEWKTGRLTGLSVLLQGNNLTNEPFITYEQGDPRRILSDEEYGRRILFGVSYKY